MGEHGITTRRELVAVGYTDAQIRAAVRAQRLTRLRPGWFATGQASESVVRAVRIGGTLTCVSALATRGVWIPQEPTGTIHVRLNDRRRYTARRSAGVRYCSVSGGGSTPEPVDDLRTALLAATRCVRGPQLVAVLDSVLNRRVLEPGALAELLRDSPRSIARAVAAVDGSAESGTETLVRLHVRSRRLPYRPQVFIPGVGRVDLLVGDRLVIESDSRQHHTGEAMETDHARDLELHRLGFLPFRVTYRQVFHQFPRFAAALDAVIARGDHRGTPEIAV